VTEHTPGPWEFLEAFTSDRPITIGEVNAPHNDIANVYSADDATVSITREQAIANARLIAAAPDLLAASRAAIIALRNRDQNGFEVQTLLALTQAVAKTV
jgi:hypothetical protein